MQRVMIVGTGGAGKSWLARRLGEATGLPVIHLDREFWKPGWVQPATEEWEARIRELIAEERWIHDGNYSGTMDLRMQRADTIVFLDVPRWRSITGVVGRRLRSGRTEVAPGCPDQLPLEFLRWLWRFPVRTRPPILERLDRHRDGREIHVLRDRRAVRRFLGTIDACRPAANATTR
jgi:adenylate kinase family enzyme